MVVKVLSKRRLKIRQELRLRKALNKNFRIYNYAARTNFLRLNILISKLANTLKHTGQTLKP